MISRIPLTARRAAIVHGPRFASRFLSPPSLRYASTGSSTRGGPGSRRNQLGFISGGLVLAFGAGLGLRNLHADAEQLSSPSSKEEDPSKSSWGALLRAYVVYSMCSIPMLVDVSPKLLEVLTGLPIVRSITEAVVRVTFFDQFVGGDSAEETVPLLQSLRASNKGTLFAYSVEVDEQEATASSKSVSKKGEKPPHQRIVDEMIHCIDVAADFEDGVVGPNAISGRRTWVAVKMTALLPDAQSLINLSTHIIANRPMLSPTVPFPGCPHPSDLDVLDASVSNADMLSPADITSLRQLHSDLVRICTRAQERGVKIIIDAEYTWYQPAIDALQLSLMRQFNKLPSRGQRAQVQPLVYGTYQAYLRRTPTHLAQSLADAKANNYALGVKLVRGAYHPHETAAYAAHIAGKPTLSISQDIHPPVWLTKAESDQTYNECAKLLIGAIRKDLCDAGGWSWGWSRHGSQKIGVLFGTHNWESCDLILDELVKEGLAEKVVGEENVVSLDEDVTERLTMGQLFGMSDSLTDYLVRRTRSSAPMIIKYVPYGALSEVMPYLSRRAIENKSVLGNGGASVERKRAGAEIRKRLFG